MEHEFNYGQGLLRNAMNILQGMFFPSTLSADKEYSVVKNTILTAQSHSQNVAIAISVRDDRLHSAEVFPEHYLIHRLA
jgi:hypothetical protein